MASVRTITIDELDRLGIDENNRLYWDKRPLVTEEKITLQRWLNVSVVLGAVSTFAVAVVEVLRFCGYGAGSGVP
jgi:hypothetical protein